MSFLSGILSSVLKGGAVKAAIRAATKGIKSGSGKVIKGLMRGVPRTIRGIKSGSAQLRVLPTALKEATVIAKSLPKGFGASNTARVAINKMSQLLGKASKGALNKDAAKRLATKLTKTLADKNKSKVLKDILKNARANETWGQYIARGAKQGKNLARSIAQGGAENVVIDKSISTAGKVLGGITAGTATALTTNAIVNKK